MAPRRAGPARGQAARLAVLALLAACAAAAKIGGGSRSSFGGSTFGSSRPGSSSWGGPAFGSSRPPALGTPVRSGGTGARARARACAQPPAAVRRPRTPSPRALTRAPRPPRAVTGNPAMGNSGSFKPAAGSALPTMPVRAPGTAGAGGLGAGAGAGGLGGLGGSRFARSGSSILPFAMGAFAGCARARGGGGGG